MLIVDKETDCFDKAICKYLCYDDVSKNLDSVAEYTFFDKKVDTIPEFSISE